MPAFRRKGDGATGRNPALVRKSMRVGAVPRTTVQLEAEFWACLAELAAERRVRLSKLVDEVAARPRPGTLASALRVFALQEARRRLAPPARRLALVPPARPTAGGRPRA